MSLNWPKPGLGHVPSYQISGIPYVTSSVIDEVPNAPGSIRVSFPFVTRFFYIHCNVNSTDDLRFGFTENGVKNQAGPYSPTGSNRNYFRVSKGGETPRIEARCTDLYFAGDGDVTSFEIVAGLTNIPRDQMSFLTGSNGFEGVG